MRGALRVVALALFVGACGHARGQAPSRSRDVDPTKRLEPAAHPIPIVAYRVKPEHGAPWPKPGSTIAMTFAECSMAIDGKTERCSALELAPGDAERFGDGERDVAALRQRIEECFVVGVRPPTNGELASGKIAAWSSGRPDRPADVAFFLRYVRESKPPQAHLLGWLGAHAWPPYARLATKLVFFVDGHDAGLARARDHARSGTTNAWADALAELDGVLARTTGVARIVVEQDRAIAAYFAGRLDVAREATIASHEALRGRDPWPALYDAMPSLDANALNDNGTLLARLVSGILVLRDPCAKP